METTLTSQTEAPVDLRLSWVQDCGTVESKKMKDRWDVPFPADHPANAILHIEYVSRGPMTLGVWQVTVLNSYIIQVELSIWQVQTVKYRAEQELFKAISNLAGYIM